MLFSENIERLFKSQNYTIETVSHTPEDIATLKILSDDKEVYVYFVYIDRLYRPYSMSLDIVPSSIYDDIQNHDKDTLTSRENSIILNIKNYLGNSIPIQQKKYFIFKYKSVDLDIDGTSVTFRIINAQA